MSPEKPKSGVFRASYQSSVKISNPLEKIGDFPIPFRDLCLLKLRVTFCHRLMNDHSFILTKFPSSLCQNDIYAILPLTIRKNELQMPLSPVSIIKKLNNVNNLITILPFLTLSGSPARPLLIKRQIFQSHRGEKNEKNAICPFRFPFIPCVRSSRKSGGIFRVPYRPETGPVLSHLVMPDRLLNGFGRGGLCHFLAHRLEKEEHQIAPARVISRACGFCRRVDCRRSARRIAFSHGSLKKGP